MNNTKTRTHQLEKEINVLSQFFCDAEKRSREIGLQEKESINKELEVLKTRVFSINNLYKENRQKVEVKYDNRLNNIKQFEEKLIDLKNSTPRIAVSIYNKLIKDPEILSNVYSQKPDFDDISSLQSKISDTSFFALIKRLFEVSGYKKRSLMVKDLTLMIEDGLKYTAEEKATCVREKKKELAIIEKQYSEQKKKTNQEQFQIENKRLKVEKKEQEDRKQFWIKTGQTPQIRQLHDHLTKTTLSSGMGVKDWGSYKKPTNTSNEICIGRVAIPIYVPKVIYNAVSSRMVPFIKTDSAINGSSIITPCLVRYDRPIHLLIKHDNASKKAAIHGIQSVLAKITHEAPPGSFDITYLDPIDRGTNLGVLQELVNLPGTTLFRSVGASKDEIQKGVSTIQSDVDSLCLALGDTKNIYEHNKHSRQKEKTHIVVINDYPKNFTQSSADALEVLINNSEKCGISLIILMNTEDAFVDKGMAELLAHALKKNPFVTITGTKGRFTIQNLGLNNELPFNFDGMKRVSKQYLETLKKGFDNRTKLDNSYKDRILNQGFNLRVCGKEVSIPFAVSSDNEIKELVISSPEIAHSIITGKNGSGKSTALHTIISGLTWFYSSDDVELWLIDYAKVEFAQYTRERIPHIRLVGLENTAEFSYGLIDKLVEEQNRRTEILYNAGYENIFDFNANCNPKDKLPRLVVIIDEFHNMSNHISSDIKSHTGTGLSYKIVMEALLREVRKLGISLIFSDQSATSGLRGLTSDARDQIHNRIAMMSNNMEDLYDAVGLKTGKYSDDQKEFIKKEGSLLLQGDTLLCETIKDEYDPTPRVIAGRYKVLYATKDDRRQMTAKVINNTSQQTVMEIFDAEGRKPFSLATIKEFERKYPVDQSVYLPLYLGTPTSLEKCYRISLETNSGNNIMVLGTDMDLKFSILFYTIRSFLRKNGNRVEILANEDDNYYCTFKDKLFKIKQSNPGTVAIHSNLQEICSELAKINDDMQAGIKLNKMIIVLGVEALLDDFSLLPKERIEVQKNKQPVSKKKADNPDDVLSALIASADDKMKEYGAKEDIEQGIGRNNASEVMDAFDARDILKTIIVQGPRRACFSLVMIERSTSFRKIRSYIELDTFDHRIATKITADDAMNFIGKSAVANGIDKNTAAYSFGGSNYTFFRPYISPGK